MMAFSASLSGVVLDTTDVPALADFYRRLLGWKIRDADANWAVVEPPGGGTHLSFQHEPLYRPPTWPSDAAAQQMMLHLDFLVDDLAAAQARAVELGATLAEFQPQEGVRVLLDPAGHPFCFFLPGW
jgi:catechol 2,3-dioxygenase-like lactoylglutathione lyase family enzyme